MATRLTLRIFSTEIGYSAIRLKTPNIPPRIPLPVLKSGFVAWTRRLHTSKIPGKGHKVPSKGSAMSYFVIGVSGVTCGGKTTLTKLLQRTFPWARIVHQDHYFYEDDYEGHLRVPEVENHVNYEIMRSMNMDQMHKDVQAILDGPGEFFDGRPGGIKNQDSQIVESSLPETAPNFDSGMELLKNVRHIDFDCSKYRNIPILIIEGFILFESQALFDKCDARFFATLNEEECRLRRSTRNYIPPDCPGYFDKIAWPEFVKHFDNFVKNRPGIKVFDGKVPIETIWKESVEITSCRLEEKYFEDERSEQKISS